MSMKTSWLLNIDPLINYVGISVFQLGWEKSRVQKKLGTI